MKKILKFIGIILAVAYAMVAIVLTICLLNYNDFNITEIDGKTFVIVRDDELAPDYKKGDLIIVEKNPYSKVQKGDKVFFYESEVDTVVINVGTIAGKQKVANSISYEVEGKPGISNSAFIGCAKTSTVVPKLGGIIGVLESRFGFLFIIIFPMLVAFIYEIYVAIKEFKFKDEN